MGSLNRQTNLLKYNQKQSEKEIDFRENLPVCETKPDMMRAAEIVPGPDHVGHFVI